MENIVKKLESAIKEVEKTQDKLNKEVEKAELLQIELSSKIRDVDEKTAILKDRENAIKHIEDVAALVKDAEDKLIEAGKREAEVKRTLSAFEKYQLEQAEVIRKDILNNKAKAEALNAREIALANREARIETEVLERVNKVIGR